METKNFTVPFGARALTITVWEDLGLCKVNKNYTSLIGWEVSKGYRLSAMERCNTFMLAVGPLAFTFSRVYLREEQQDD